MRTVAVILAGGRATRMEGRDKPLVKLAGRTLIVHIVERLGERVGAIAVNANGDKARFEHLGLPIVRDSIAGQPGPLAGILAAMDWASTRNANRVLTLAGDTPFIPPELADRLSEAAHPDGVIAVAKSGARRHPVVALWPTNLRHDLRAQLTSGGSRKVNAFIDMHPNIDVHFGAILLPGGPADPFFNINSPSDLVTAERLLHKTRP